jgi:NAD(P)-dependent dehydrogenase (short-subunit alcohol dehydrogenase family)
VERFKDRVALVTGAASGLGRGLALGLAKAGARVIAADIDAAGLAALGGPSILSQPLDVRDAPTFKRTAQAAAARLGRIDYLFNVAGIAAAGEMLALAPDSWRSVIDVNLMGTVNGIAAVYPLMARAGAGHIVNMASITGLLPFALLAPYAASKAAIVSLSESLRLEAETHGVRVTLICPGFIETDIYRKAEAPPGVGEDRSTLVPFKKIDVERAVRTILNGVARDKARIVFPAYWRWCWRLWRIHPALLMPGARRALREARAAIAEAQKP